MFTSTHRVRAADDDRARTLARLAAMFPRDLPPPRDDGDLPPPPMADQPGDDLRHPPLPPQPVTRGGPTAAETVPADPPAGVPSPSQGDGGAGRRRGVPRLRSLLSPAGPSVPGRLLFSAGPGLLTRRSGVLVLLTAGTIAAVCAGALVLHARPVAEPVPPVTRATAPTTPGPSPSASPRRAIVVAVAGKVRHPGLVTLPEGARVADAVDAAGGPAHGSDLGLLNLARRLSDGEQVIVGVAAGGSAATGCAGCPAESAGAGSSGGGSPPNPVDVNTAGAGDLDALPGIGPVTAARIVDWRTRHGPFTSVDQLREVPGIGPSKLARIRPLVVL